MVRKGQAPLRLAGRSIRRQKGRYAALFLIVFLSVGFLAGLKVTRAQMWDAAGRYFDTQNLYDFRLLSTIGFSEDDVASLASADGAADAEGAYSTDILMTFGGNTEDYLCMSLPERVNRPSLTAGRMPETDSECLADHRAFSEADIGKTVTVSDRNDEEASGALSNPSYTIVGLVNSPLFLSADRGAAASGGRERKGFLYLPAGNFTSEAYTEADLVLNARLKSGEAADVFSGAYGRMIGSVEDAVREKTEELAAARYTEILKNIRKGLQKQQDLSLSGLLNIPMDPVSQDDAEKYAEEHGVEKPQVYVLTREDNAGYAGFRSDTSILYSIADIFPVFFILIALLVCITTMLRMVDEERGEIGTLKALGFSGVSIARKYILYAGSAALLGWAAGFPAGTFALPRGFWAAYSTLYDFIGLRYLFDPALAAATLLTSLLSVTLGTGAACAKALRETPAALIRPKSARPGRRIALERLTPLWNRLSFLGKSVLRNMFRYRIRMVMMLAGVGCSAALIITAFGVRDSMVHVGEQQYGGVQTYQIEATADTERRDLTDLLAEVSENGSVTEVLPVRSRLADVRADTSSMSSVTLLVFEDGADPEGFWNLTSLTGGGISALPPDGEALVSKRLAEKLDLTPGTAFTVRDEGEGRLTAADAFFNFVGNFILVSRATYENAFGTDGAPDTLLIRTETLSDAEEKELCEKLGRLDGVTGATRLSERRASVDRSVSCLNAIIWLIVAFAGALSFVVIFNLTNVNIAERRREIATVEVLGFRPAETRFYVLRENVVLSAAAGFLGMLLGYPGTYAVMSRILLDSLTYRITVAPASYLIAPVCTAGFALIVNGFMRRQIRKIDMAESLKAAE